MTEKQTIRVDATAPDGHCGVCLRELTIDESRIVMGTTFSLGQEETLVSCIICRSCLSEYIPALLEESEED